jgi:Putative beta-barrel porin-2, OmpL-like. bbp2
MFDNRGRDIGIGIAIAFFLTISLTVSAQSLDSIIARDTSTKIKLWMYAEPYFAYDFNNPVSKNIPYLVNYSRQNDFTLNLALIDLDYQSTDARASIGLQMGSYALAAYSAEPSLYKNIYQAFAGVQIVPNLWLDAGVFQSHFGIETALGKDQWTLTRSLCSENTPYFETGLRATYTPNSPWSFTFFVLNGWQNIVDSNSNKALGTQIQYTIANHLTLNSSTFFGNEKPDSAREWRFYHDFFAVWNVTESFGISGLFDIGWQQEAPHSDLYYDWYTFAFIGRYKLSSMFAFSARVEQFTDPNEVLVFTGTPDGYQVFGYSVNLDYLVSEHATFRIEAKHYNSNEDIFIRNGEPVSGSTVLTSSLAVSF